MTGNVWEWVQDWFSANFHADNLPEDSDEDGLLRQGLFRYLTLYSYAPNVNRFGEPRIDLNTASQPVTPPMRCTSGM